VNRRWFEQEERGAGYAKTVIRWIALHMGRRVGRALLYPIVSYFLLTPGIARRSSRSFLKLALNRRPSSWDVARHIHCFAATVLDRVYFMAEQFERFDIHVHNEAVLRRQVERGRGCILLGAHLGSFDALRTLALRQRGVPLKVLMYKERNAATTELLEGLNPEVAASAIRVAGPGVLLEVQEHLQAGGHIGMLGDRVAKSDRVTYCHFMGRRTVFPIGPMLLAGALKAPVILLFGLYGGANRYDIYFESLAEQVVIRRAHRNEDAHEWTQKYAEYVERYAREAPYNWFNFYDYWHDEEKDGFL
jgi:predicted LPLAT superfamily acyltransferase